MRCLKRNQRYFWYAVYTGEAEQVDVDGLYTGDIGPGYGEPVRMKANISAAKGAVEQELFGADIQYSKTIATEDLACPITEESAIWIGIEPTDKAGKAVPHNYVVKGIAESLNHIIYAVDEVKQSTAKTSGSSDTPDDTEIEGDG